MARRARPSLRRDPRDPFEPAPVARVERFERGARPEAADVRQRRPGGEERDTLRHGRVMAWALVPLRLFLGGTFLYAGIDKLVDPAFLRPAGLGSIGDQLRAFERVSPIAPIVHLFGDPFPILIGLAISFAEIGIGLGALLGLLFRIASLGGAALSFLFFLTASWDTHPYYYGPDLPYMVGWITLALAGHAHVYALEDVLIARAREAPAPARRGRAPVRGLGYAGVTSPRSDTGFVDTERREFLQLAILALASAIVAMVASAWPFKGTLPVETGDTGNTGAATGATPGPTTDAGGSVPTSATATGGATAPPGATQIGDLSTLKAQSAIAFQDPTSGDPGVVVELADGNVACFDAVCTHEGCTVEYVPSDKVLFCPCHGAVFDPAHDAAVLQGPARQPLTKLPITIDKATGRIYLQA